MVAPTKPKGPEDLNCPQWLKPMSKVCHSCAWWTPVSTTDPATGKTIEDWACAISWMPKLMFENAKQTHAAGAAIESFRNEMTQVGSGLVKIASNNR
jgi:hypothetical protein